MKDLSRYSDKDKSAVIGVGLKSKNKKTEEEALTTSEVSKVDLEKPAAVKNSEISLNDYFSMKMAKFYAKKNGPKDESPEEQKLSK